MSQLIMTVRPLYPVVAVSPLDASTQQMPVKVMQAYIGERGPPGAGTAFVFDQLTPSALWTIPHNMGYRPSVEITTLGGMEVDGEVLHLSSNLLTIAFNPPLAGSARLN
jgi:hypothetical protein